MTKNPPKILAFPFQGMERHAPNVMDTGSHNTSYTDHITPPPIDLRRLYKDSEDISEHIDELSYHEAGHAIISTLNPNHGEVISAEMTDELGGVAHIETYPNKGTKEYFMGQMLISAGGVAATNIHFKEIPPEFEDSSDKERLEEAIKYYFEKFGYPYGKKDIDAIFEHQGAESEFLLNPSNIKSFFKKVVSLPPFLQDKAIEVTVEKSIDKAQELLEENSKALNLIAEIIKEDWEISGEDVRQIVEECQNAPALQDDLVQ